MTPRVNLQQPKGTRSPAEKRVHEALDNLCRERDAELFKLQRQSCAHRDRAAKLEDSFRKLAVESNMTKHQADTTEGETVRVMVSFFLIGACVASAGWYTAIFIV